MAPELREMLAEYVPATGGEAAFRERMLALAGTARPFERTSFEPGHFTASAFVLAPERDAVLLIFHGKLRRWLQPGGHVEPADRSMVDAARREVAEEVGLAELVPAGSAPLFDLDVHEIPARPGEPAHEHFDVRFLFVARSRTFARTAEVLDARWVALDAIETVTDDVSVRRVADKLRRASR